MRGSPPTPIAIDVPDGPEAGAGLAPDALAFVADLHCAFDLPRRRVRAEIPRTQLWQWLRPWASIDGGGAMTRDYYLQVRAEALARLDSTANAASRIADAGTLLDTLVIGDVEDISQWLANECWNE